MFGLYDLNWNFIAGPFDTSEDAMSHAIAHGVFPFKIKEM